MANIKNLEGLTFAQISNEIERGAKFVTFPYAVSIIVMTFRRGSDIYFVRGDESSFKHSYGFILITLLFGWWGIPWGPIYSIGSLFSNLTGGKDVTQEVLQFFIENASQQAEVQAVPVS